MKSASQKGSYYKMRSKKWLEAQGYSVGYLERMQRIFKPGSTELIFVKRDQFASDILAVNKDEVIFVQVKLGNKNTADAIRKFKEFPCPPPAKQWVMTWEVGARQPEIVDVAEIPETVPLF